VKTFLIGFIIGILLAAAAWGEPRPGHHHQRDNRNYIIRRQQAYQVQGVPVRRLYIGGRKIDIYRNGLMFEGDNVVGMERGPR
jgi:hypothetical protein